MTREEIKAFGKHIVDKVFHKHGHETKFHATITNVDRTVYTAGWYESRGYRKIIFTDWDIPYKKGDKVEITIKKI